MIANLLEVETRTLRLWKKDYECEVPKRGRKQKKLRFAEVMAIAREWRRQGFPGSRPIEKVFPQQAARLIRKLVGELKTRRRKHLREQRDTYRKTIHVPNSGVFVAMDAASLPKEGGDYIVYRDRGSLSANASRCDQGHHRSSDTLNVLEELKKKGRLPLVISTDNGPGFCSGKVDHFLMDNKVVHLKSLPYVPEHNGSAESAVGDFKTLVVGHGLKPAVACKILNENRLRKKLGFKTSHEVEKLNLKVYTDTERAVFYEETRTAIKLAVHGTRSAYEKRKLERVAILDTMVKFSLITIKQGSSTRFPKPEEIT